MGDFEKLAAASDEHAARSGKTPSVVLDALLPGDAEVCGIRIHAFTLGMLLLLEKIDHPEISGKEASISDSANALYIFAAPLAAKAALARGRDQFEQAAFEFCLEKIPAGALTAFGEAIRDQIKKGMSTVPGKFVPGQEGGDADPLAPSRQQTPGSAGN